MAESSSKCCGSTRIRSNSAFRPQPNCPSIERKFTRLFSAASRQAKKAEPFPEPALIASRTFPADRSSKNPPNSSPLWEGERPREPDVPLPLVRYFFQQGWFELSTP